MEWVGPDGEQYSHTFEDALDRARSGQRLRTALSLSGEWLPAVLDQAHEQLMAIREVHHHAGGLVIAMDHEHARGIVDLLRRRHGVTATLALSDDPTASARIEHFAEGSQPWIVAVRMVSEGVDIPRLRVGVFATNTATELFFRQAVGRLVRWTRGMRHQKAFFFIPDDPRLRTFAAGLAEQRRHSLRRREQDADDDGPTIELDEVAPEVPEDEQLSLFAAISAVALGDPHTPEWLADELDEAEDDLAQLDEGDADDGLTIALSPPPRPGAGVLDAMGVAVAGAPPQHRTRREHKAHLRKENADWAREIVRLSGLSHAQVNRELNRLAGIRAISEATVEQLERRLRAAESWLRRL
jgi:superfamily II DNA or RNA helicase